MKKLLFWLAGVIFLFALTPPKVSAWQEEVSYGIKAGLNSSIFTDFRRKGDFVEDPLDAYRPLLVDYRSSAKAGMALGSFFNIPVDYHTFIQSEIMYFRRGAKSSASKEEDSAVFGEYLYEDEQVLSLSYLELVFLFMRDNPISEYSSLNWHTGLSLAFNLKAEVERDFRYIEYEDGDIVKDISEVGTFDVKEGVRPVDISVVAGVGYTFNRYTIELRSDYSLYALSFSDIDLYNEYYNLKLLLNIDL